MQALLLNAGTEAVRGVVRRERLAGRLARTRKIAVPGQPIGGDNLRNKQRDTASIRHSTAWVHDCHKC